MAEKKKKGNKEGTIKTKKNEKDEASSITKPAQKWKLNPPLPPKGWPPPG